MIENALALSLAVTNEPSAFFLVALMGRASWRIMSQKDEAKIEF